MGPDPVLATLAATHRDPEPATAPPLLAWLLDLPALADSAAASPAEQAHLARIAALAADPLRAATLVPRTAAVVPQLLRVLRDDSEGRRAWAQRISKDPVLSAEVLRLAASARYGVAGPLADLEDAVGALGVDGVRSAIARVVLKPVFQGASDSLSQRAAPRLWQHAQHQAWRASGLAADAGVEPFEAYLAGLLHDTGWTVALRTIDNALSGAGALACGPFSRPFAERLHVLATQLFARVLADWRLSPALDALADELLDRAQGGDDACGSPLARLLHRADRLATGELA